MGKVGLVEAPCLTVVVPAHNASATLARCLMALNRNSYADWQGIVVADGCYDQSAHIARSHGFQVIELSPPAQGPAFARNIAAALSTARYIAFIDSDVVVGKHTLDRLVANLSKDSTVVACFGSYDDRPAHPGFFSRFKNLQHHYVHQNAASDASTFWAGCGIVRRHIFEQVGGFDLSYTEPSIEDIELGYRLSAAGRRIVLDKEIQVKHLKSWTLRSWLVTEIRYRALPWSKLLVRRRIVERNLNLTLVERISAALSLALPVTGLVALFLGVYWWVAPFAASLALLILNRRFYLVLQRKQGTRFAAAAIPCHWLYYGYSALTYLLVWGYWRSTLTIRNRFERSKLFLNGKAVRR